MRQSRALAWPELGISEKLRTGMEDGKRTSELWTGLLPVYGRHAHRMAIVGVLKLARGRTLDVTRSTLTFVDASGGAIGELRDAFALTEGARRVGPLSQRLLEERPRPPGAFAMGWTLGDRRTETVPVVDEGPSAGELTLTCTPMQVPVREDFQLWVQYVNHTGQMVDLCKAVRSATLWIDGVGRPSTTGGHWDGRSSIHPGEQARYGFRMSDFDGAPLLGTHDLAVEMFGQRTRARSVCLEGEPWPRP